MATEQNLERTDIFVLTGELSGDMLGYDLLKEVSKSAKIEGVLGPNLKTLEISEFLSMDALNFMGLSKPIASIYKIISSFKKIEKRILKTNPKILLLIDLPDINLKMAKRVRKKGYKGKIIQVVCPTIWAWRPKRKAILEKYYDHLLCLFPFEKELFKDSPLKVSYIGHPLSSIVPEAQENKKNIIAIFPGSRKQEVETLLPTFLEACKCFHDYKIHISVAKESLKNTIETLTKGYNVTLRNPKEKDALIKEASFALSKNGTINLELALSYVPQITCYRITGLERFIFTNFFKVFLPHYSLPNILLKKRAVPELIGPLATKKNIISEFSNLVSSPYIQEAMLEDYKKLSKTVKESLMEDGATLLSSQL